MFRHAVPPRENWRAVVEAQGMLYHSSGDQVYWDESAYYEFTPEEIDELEAATFELDRMCLQAVEHILQKDLFDRFQIPSRFRDYVRRSWETDETTIYGRFDLAYDGRHPPKLLEYNADTPTALLEASVIQWYWLQDLRARQSGTLDQFNSIHERLIEAWQSVREDIAGSLYFASVEDHLEDYMTVNYLRDTAIQAGYKTAYIPIEQIGWNDAMECFVDTQDMPIWNVFKLYPWEWMVAETFGEKTLLNKTRFFEPPWKMLLSNKAILTVLWELFPSSPYLLPTTMHPSDSSYVSKPLRAREGANITVVHEGAIIAETTGAYDDEPRVYQQYWPLPRFEGYSPVIGSWMVNGHACGIGIREDTGLITGNTSRFVPHCFRP